MQACPLAHSIFLGLNIDDARVIGVDVGNDQVGFLPFLGTKPLTQALTGLALNLGRDVFPHREQCPCQCGKVIGKAETQNDIGYKDIGNEVQRQDEIAERAQDLEFETPGDRWITRDVVEHEHIIDRLAASLLRHLLQLLPQLAVVEVLSILVEINFIDSHPKSHMKWLYCTPIAANHVPI